MDFKRKWQDTTALKIIFLVKVLLLNFFQCLQLVCLSLKIIVPTDSIAEGLDRTVVSTVGSFIAERFS